MGAMKDQATYEDEIQLFLKKSWCDRVGSRETCNPPPMNTDDDRLIFCQDEKTWTDSCRFLIDAGFVENENDSYMLNDDTKFRSLKKGELNILITKDEPFHTRFLAATHVAKKLNLMAKAERILLFQAVLYGNQIEPEDFA